MKEITINLKIWRQAGPKEPGSFLNTKLSVSEEISFLEMLDMLNERLISEKKDPIAFESDCREGICGACSLMVNGIPHGPWDKTTVCQLHMRAFKNNSLIVVEPFRAKSFPVIKDLVVDRSAFDRIMRAGGFISAKTGSAVDANTVLIKKKLAETAFDMASCIGCGACVAACKNSSAMLFVSSKVAHLSHLPQGDPERQHRAISMVLKMDEEGFGSCTNTLECEAVCPKGINSEAIGVLNHEFLRGCF